MTKPIFGAGLGSTYVYLDGNTSGQVSHAVVGEPTRFYLYVREGQKPASHWSQWIVGDMKTYKKLIRLHLERKARAFADLVEMLHRENPK